jgi:hypothetical protein
MEGRGLKPVNTTRESSDAGSRRRQRPSTYRDAASSFLPLLLFRVSFLCRQLPRLGCLQQWRNQAIFCLSENIELGIATTTQPSSLSHLNTLFPLLLLHLREPCPDSVFYFDIPILTWSSRSPRFLLSTALFCSESGYFW